MEPGITGNASTEESFVTSPERAAAEYDQGPPPIAPRSPPSFACATWLLVAGNSAVFLVPYLIGAVPWNSMLSLASAEQGRLGEFGAVLPFDTMRGEPWRLLTGPQLHAWLPHLFFNMIALLSIAPALEALLGSWWLLFVYLCSGVCASLGSALFSEAVSVGASGAVLGVACALLVTLIRKRNMLPAAVRFRVIPLLASLLLLQVAAGLAASSYFSLPVDNAAHLSGSAAGLALGLLSPFALPSLLRIAGRSVLVAAVSVAFALPVLLMLEAESLLPMSATQGEEVTLRDLRLQFRLPPGWREWDAKGPRGVHRGWRNSFGETLELFIERGKAAGSLPSGARLLEESLRHQEMRGDILAWDLIARIDLSREGPGGILLAAEIEYPSTLSPGGAHARNYCVWRLIEMKEGMVRFEMNIAGGEPELESAIQFLRRINLLQ